MSIVRFLIMMGIAFVTTTATANVLTSTACAPGTRIFSVNAETVLGCLMVGSGNINGGNGSAGGDKPFIDQGWSLLDQSSGSNDPYEGWLSGSLSSGLTGEFNISKLAYLTFDQIAIGFKSGGGQLSPDWAIFGLADNTFTGKWSISFNDLSHAILYGRGTPPPTQVPEPATAVLLGLGFLGILVSRRRRYDRYGAKLVVAS